MLSKSTILTILSRLLILLSNFAVVIVSSQIWGSEGRGEIALVFANIALIDILNNVLCGTTLAFNSKKLNKNDVVILSTCCALIFSLIGAVLFSSIYGFNYFVPLLFIPLLKSISLAIGQYWLGKNNISWYNSISVLGVVLVLLVLFIQVYLSPNPLIEIFYNAYYGAYTFVWLIAIIGLYYNKEVSFGLINRNKLYEVIKYGFKNEFNFLIQFLNYRLSYFFIAAYLSLDDLGVFSVSVAIVEAVWVVSKSMSTIQFSKVINTNDKLSNIYTTSTAAKQSLVISTLVLMLVMLTPISIFQFVFGHGFGQVKTIALYLSPGVIAIAASNLYGHYFAAIGELKELRYKSLLGLVATVILLPVLIPRFELIGACITLNVSYILSSLYLLISFLKQTNKVESLHVK